MNFLPFLFIPLLLLLFYFLICNWNFCLLLYLKGRVDHYMWINAWVTCSNCASYSDWGGILICLNCKRRGKRRRKNGYSFTWIALPVRVGLSRIGIHPPEALEACTTNIQLSLIYEIKFILCNIWWKWLILKVLIYLNSWEMYFINLGATLCYTVLLRKIS